MVSRGLWLCIDNSRQRRNAMANLAPNSKAAEKGYPLATTGCGKWNVYVSTSTVKKDRRDRYAIKKYYGTGGYNKPRQIDTNCRHCGRRVRFQQWRRDARGRPSSVAWDGFPSYTALDELIEECNIRNRTIDGQSLDRGFVRAREYRRE